MSTTENRIDVSGALGFPDCNTLRINIVDERPGRITIDHTKWLGEVRRVNPRDHLRYGDVGLVVYQYIVKRDAFFSQRDNFKR